MLPLIAQVITPVFLGLLLHVFKSKYVKYIAIVLQCVLLIDTISDFFLLKNTSEIIMLLSTYQLPAGMSLRLDTLSAIMLLLNNTLFLTLTIYNLKNPYMDKLFVFLFLSLQGILNGVFLSNDLFNVYVLIEISTVIVSILIMYKKDSQAMYDGMIYIMVNMVGMAFFLFGIGYIYKVFGLFDFGGIKKLIPLIENPRVLVVPYGFLLTGIALKSAIIPLFSWLPKAHGTASAPYVVSAVLSGIFVKTGVYLFIRTTGIFNIVLDVQSFFLWTGYFTAFIGVILAISQIDIKLILAYHTISQIGLIMIGINIGKLQAFKGGLYHILGHGIFKALLFILAGVLIDLYKTRNIKVMKGLWGKSKFTSIALVIAILSITGSPFFSGCYSKTLIMAGSNRFEYILFILINFGTMLSFVKFYDVLFMTDLRIEKTTLHLSQRIGIVVFMVICFALGALGNPLSKILLENTYSNGLLKQFKKIPEYFFYLTLAFFTYKTWLKKSNKLQLLRKLDFSFNMTIFSITSFFITIIIYLYGITVFL